MAHPTNATRRNNFSTIFPIKKKKISLNNVFVYVFFHRKETLTEAGDGDVGWGGVCVWGGGGGGQQITNNRKT